MAKRVGEYEVVVDADTKEAQKSIDNLSKSAEKSGGIFSRVFGGIKAVVGGIAKTIAGIGAAMASVFAIAKSTLFGPAIMNIAQDLISGFANIRNNIRNTGKQLGMSFGPENQKKARTLIDFATSGFDKLNKVLNITTNVIFGLFTKKGRQKIVNYFKAITGKEGVGLAVKLINKLQKAWNKLATTITEYADKNLDRVVLKQQKINHEFLESESKMRKTDKELSELSKQYDLYRSVLISTKSEMNKLESEMNNVNSNTASGQKKIVELRQRYNTLQTTFKQTSKNTTELRDKMLKLSQSNKETKKSADKLWKTNEKTDKQARRTAKIYNSVYSVGDKLRAGSERLAKTHEKLNDKINKYNKELGINVKRNKQATDKQGEFKDLSQETVTVQDGLKSAFESLPAPLQKLFNIGKKALAIFASYKIIIAIFQKFNEVLDATTKAFITQAVSVAKLEQGLINVGEQGKLQGLLSDFEELQNLTGFADDNIAQAATVLTTFGLSTETIGEVIPTLLDVQAVVGDTSDDLTSVANQFGKLFSDPESFAATLSRQGVIIDLNELKEITEVEEQRQFVLEEINRQYGGMAEAIEGVNLSTNKAKNAMDAAKESIGEALAPLKEAKNEFLTKFFTYIADNGKKIVRVLGLIAALLGAVAIAIGGMFAPIGIVVTTLGLLVSMSAKVTDVINDSTEAFNNYQEAQEAVNDSTEDTILKTQELRGAYLDLIIAMKEAGDEYERLQNKFDRKSNRAERIQERIDELKEEALGYADTFGMEGMSSDEFISEFLTNEDAFDDSVMDRFAAGELEQIVDEITRKQKRLNRISEDTVEIQEDMTDIAETYADAVEDGTVKLEEMPTILQKAVEKYQALNKESSMTSTGSTIGDTGVSVEDITKLNNAIDRFSGLSGRFDLISQGNEEERLKYAEKILNNTANTAEATRLMGNNLSDYYDSLEKVVNEEGELEEMEYNNLTYTIDTLTFMKEILKTKKDLGELTEDEVEMYEQITDYLPEMDGTSESMSGTLQSQLGDLETFANRAQALDNDSTYGQLLGAAQELRQEALGVVESYEGQNDLTEEQKSELEDALVVLERFEKTSSDTESNADEIADSFGELVDSLGTVLSSMKEVGIVSERTVEYFNDIAELGKGVAGIIASQGTDISSWASAISSVVGLMSKVFATTSDTEIAMRENVKAATDLLYELELIDDTLDFRKNLGLDVTLQEEFDALIDKVNKLRKESGIEFDITGDGTIANAEQLDDIYTELSNNIHGLEAAQDNFTYAIEGSGRAYRKSQLLEGAQELVDAGLVSQQYYNDLQDALNDWKVPVNIAGTAEYLENIAETGLTDFESWQESMDSITESANEYNDLLEEMGVSDEARLAILQAQESLFNSQLEGMTEGSDEYLSKQEEIDANLESQIDALQDKLAEEESVIEQYNLQTQIQELQNRLAEKANELEKSRNELIEERLDLLNDAVDLGYLDVENLRDKMILERNLTQLGVSGVELGKQLSGLGVSNSNTVNIGQIQTNVNTNNPDVVNSNVEESIINSL